MKHRQAAHSRATFWGADPRTLRESQAKHETLSAHDCDTLVIRFAGWRLDLEKRHLVSPTSTVVALSDAEFRLLAVFVAHSGALLTRTALLTLAARDGGLMPGDRSIDLVVSRLRRKLGRESALIRTVRGEGYVFDATVERCDDSR